MLIVMWMLQLDQDYHPGRRKRGKDYKDGMVGYDEFTILFLCLYVFGMWESKLVLGLTVFLNGFCSTSYRSIILAK